MTTQTSGAGPNRSEATDGPDALEVTAALRSVLASEPFVRSPGSRKFLAYVVTEALAGRGADLSERTIGRRVMGQSEAFDGRFTSMVRVRGSRVRSNLVDYYGNEGVYDPVRILLPAGTYCPTFERIGQPGTEQGLEAGVVVLRTEHAGTRPAAQIAHTLADAVVHRLAGFPGVRVIGPTTTAQPSGAIGAAQRLGLRFVLQTSVAVRQDEVRLSASLTDARTGDVVWTATRADDLSSFSGFEVEDDWASAVAGQLGDWTGVIHRSERQYPGSQQPSLSYGSYLAFCAYQENPTPDAIEAAALSLDAAIAAGDRSPTILALRGWIATAEAAQSQAPSDAATCLEQAEALAREALSEQPTLAQAHVVLCNVALIRGQWDLVASLAARVAELASYHPATLFAAANAAGVSGDWERAVELANEAFRLNPHLPGAYHVLPALAAILAGDDAAALAEASLINTPGQPWGPLYRALALGGLGYLDQAWEEMDGLLEIEPDFLDDPLAFFRTGMRCSDADLASLQGHIEPFLRPRCT